LAYKTRKEKKTIIKMIILDRNELAFFNHFDTMDG